MFIKLSENLPNDGQKVVVMLRKPDPEIDGDMGDYEIAKYAAESSEFWVSNFLGWQSFDIFVE